MILKIGNPTMEPYLGGKVNAWSPFKNFLDLACEESTYEA